MRWLSLMDKLRAPLLVLPAVALVVLLFFGGLVVGFSQSLGYFPAIGSFDLTLRYYGDVLTDNTFFESLWQTFRLALLSTVMSSVLAIALALVLRNTFKGSRFFTFMFQLSIPIPHLVAAAGIVLLVSQSGILARGAYALGLIDAPRNFPVMVFDRPGTAIQLTYLWKEVPFIGIVVLAILQGVGPQYEEIARTLGANAWQRFRYVLLPLILPGVLSTSMCPACASMIFLVIASPSPEPALLAVVCER